MNNKITKIMATMLALLACQFINVKATAAGGMAAEELDGKVRITIDGKLFTEYIYKGNKKPYLYPVIGAEGIAITRNYPMKKVEGESSDHPHQSSLWYNHGSVNGVDFWNSSEQRPGNGEIVQDKMHVMASKEKVVIYSRNNWQTADGKLVCSDRRATAFSSLENGDKIIDFEIKIVASNGDVTFGDSKEGSMGIRTHPELRLKPVDKKAKSKAQALNSAGDKGASLWGKSAKWVDYWSEIEGKTVGIAIFDHPGNPRHPTTWHARDYGLIAANPFGISYFKKQPKGAGDMKIKAGESVTFRYRFLFHKGDPEAAGTAKQFDAFAKTESILRRKSE